MSPALPLALLSLLAASPREVLVHRQTRTVMHTVVTVAIAEERPPEQLRAWFDEAFAVFERVDQVMNEWRPDSPLSAINAAAGKDAVVAPKDLCQVLELALEGARRTQGLFDPTWAALREVWRFPEEGRGKVPSTAAVKAACAKVDYRQVELAGLAGEDPARGCTVRLRRPGMALGLGGLVKGWAVDQAVARLRALGAKDFFVQAGGDLYLAGTKGGQPWRVGIRDPRGPPDKLIARVEVRDGAFSTSGDYERYFVVRGQRYHHLIDPRTCRPGRKARSATVLAASATDAEVLTKAVFLQGKEGLALAQALEAEAVVVDERGRVHVSAGLDGKVELTRSASAPD
jgi:FAD:protein FMN transferase